MQGKVTISHAYDLGSVSEAVSRRLIDEFAELDVAMATVAPSTTGHLRLVDLVEAGVRVGLGEDGQRDYWSPYGNCDMLDRTWQLAFVNGFRRDDHIELALAVATMGGASIMSHSHAAGHGRRRSSGRLGRRPRRPRARRRRDPDERRDGPRRRPHRHPRRPHRRRRPSRRRHLTGRVRRTGLASRAGRPEPARGGRQSMKPSRRLPITRPPRMPPMRSLPPPRRPPPQPAACSTVARRAPLLGLRAGGVDVALGELQRLAREERGAAGHGERLLAVVLVDRRDRGGRRAEVAVEVEAHALGLGEAGAGVGADPAAVPGDDVARDGELPVGVVDRVPDVLERGDRARGALAGLGDRGVQSGIRLAQERQLLERIGVDAGGRAARPGRPAARRSRR